MCQEGIGIEVKRLTEVKCGSEISVTASQAESAHKELSGVVFTPLFADPLEVDTSSLHSSRAKGRIKLKNILVCALHIYHPPFPVSITLKFL